MNTEQLDSIMRSSGAVAWGVATAEPVDSEAWERRERWISDGNNAGMEYLDRYPGVRRDPRNLLGEARSVIVAAYSYYPSRRQPAYAPQFAWYAYGRDYHEVVRARLERVASRLDEVYAGARFRICVDTAPLMERYWAVKAGVGFIGRNAQLIVPGHGSACFLGEIVTTIPLPASTPSEGACPDGCDLCIRACPGGAISRECTVDARRCLSYLTIEHRGAFTDGMPQLGRRIYGCDACQSACPLNRGISPTDIPEFSPSEALMSLTDSDIATLTPERFSSIFSHSAVKRAKLAGLLRNLSALTPRYTGPPFEDEIQ